MFSQEPINDSYFKLASLEVTRIVEQGKPEAGIGDLNQGISASDHLQRRIVERRLFVWDTYIEYCLRFVDQGFGEESGTAAKKALIEEVAETNRRIDSSEI